MKIQYFKVETINLFIEQISLTIKKLKYHFRYLKLKQRVPTYSYIIFTMLIYDKQ